MGCSIRRLGENPTVDLRLGLVMYYNEDAGLYFYAHANCFFLSLSFVNMLGIIYVTPVGTTGLGGKLCLPVPLRRSRGQGRGGARVS